MSNGFAVQEKSASFRFEPVRHLITLLASSTVLIFVAFAAFLLIQSWPWLSQNALGFLTGKQWSFRHESFGALSMIYGTMVVTVVALIVGGSLGVGSAIFVSELIPMQFQKWSTRLRLFIELLSGIPSVVYGLLGVIFLSPFIHWIFGSQSGDTLLTGGLLLGIMILPTVAAVTSTVLRSISGEVRLQSRALGFTQSETVWYTVLPQAWPGIVSALLLGIGRAFGETIAVYLVVGRADNRFPEDFGEVIHTILGSGQTLTSKLGGTETNLAYATGNPHWSAIVGLGLVLFVSVLIFSAIARKYFSPSKKKTLEGLQHD